MSELVAAPAFAKLSTIGSGDGVRVRLKSNLVLASVLARAGKMEALIDQAQAVLGLALTDIPGRAAAGTVSALGIGPGRWLFLQDNAGADSDLLAALSASLSGLASICDHSDGYAVFEISGPRVRDALAKGVPVDLHESTFGSTAAAVTVVAHIGAILWREEPDRFVIAVFRSYAESLWHWLSASAAEFGLQALP